jgi:hypothetical protein
MMLFLIVSITLSYAGFRIQLPALFLYFVGYNFSSLIFHFYEKQMIAFMENAAETLSWVDPLMRLIPHTDLALRNICSVNLGLLNLMYIYTSTGGCNNS